MNVRRKELLAPLDAAHAPRREAAHPEPVRPKLRIVPSVRVRRRRASVLGLLACGLVFGFMVGLTAFQAQLAQNQQLVDQASTELRTEQLKFDRSRREIAGLQSPKNILDRATKMGMYASTSAVYLEVKSDVVTEVLVAAGGGADAAAASASSTRPDWSAYKKISAETP